MAVLFRFVLAVLLVLSDRALAQESRLQAILASGALRVGTTGDYPPFSLRDPATGEMSGFDVEMAASLGRALGVKVVFAPTSWPNLARDLGAGAFDIAMGGVSITLDRQKSGFFSVPYLTDGKTPIVRCADKQHFQTLADIDRPGVRVIANPGGTNERFDRANLHDASIVIHADNRTIFDALAAGEADVMITDASETRFQETRRPGVLCAIHPDRPFNAAQKAYWMPPDPDLKAFVDRWLNLALETGEVRALSARWFGDEKGGP